MNIRLNILSIFLFPLGLIAQNGGSHAFSFINIEVSPISQAIGGNSIAIYDNHILASQSSPSLLNSSMHNEISFGFVDYLSDINLLSFAYARDIRGFGVISFGIKSINYGFFDLTDEFGNINGSFSAHDQVLSLSFAKKLDKLFSLGGNINLLNSNYSNYSASAVFSNISITYYNSNNRFASTLLLKNLGRQLSSYTDEKETIPFEIQFALSKKLKYLPFRYHICYTHLEHFNISSPYKLNVLTNTQTGELEIQQETFAKTFLRHIIIGGELNPFNKSLFLRGGFNFQRRFDMSLATRPAMVGFSFGVGFNVHDFSFNYSRSIYHLSGILNNFSIGININKFTS